MKKIYYF